MSFGFTAAGYVHKKYADILSEMRESVRDKGYTIGAYDPISVILSIVAASLSLTWEALQFSFWQGDEDRQYGKGLDRLYSRIDVVRIQAAPSYGIVRFTGPVGIVIPDGAILESKTGHKIKVVNSHTINASGFIDATARCIEKGPIVIKSGDVAILQQSIAGVSLVNTRDFKVGRDKETDVEMRIRKRKFSKGNFTVQAIISKLFTIDGVTDAIVVVNNFAGVVNGRPGQSVEAVVLGGDDQKIINILGESISAGNLAVSTASGADKISGVWVDPIYSNSVPVAFSRPSLISKSINVKLVSKFPISISEIEKVKNEVVKYSQRLKIGDDIHTWEIRALCDIVSDLQNVIRVNVTISNNSADFIIGDFEIASIQSADINISNVVLV